MSCTPHPRRDTEHLWTFTLETSMFTVDIADPPRPLDWMTNCYITAHSGNHTAAPVFDLLTDPVTLITLLLYTFKAGYS